MLLKSERKRWRKRRGQLESIIFEIMRLCGGFVASNCRMATIKHSKIAEFIYAFESYQLLSSKQFYYYYYRRSSEVRRKQINTILSVGRSCMPIGTSSTWSHAPSCCSFVQCFQDKFKAGRSKVMKKKADMSEYSLFDESSSFIHWLRPLISSARANYARVVLNNGSDATSQSLSSFPLFHWKWIFFASRHHLYFFFS